MIYPIHLYGHPVLRKETETLSADYPDLEQVINNMFATLDKAGGIGLAAPQVGLALRLFIVDLDPFADEIPEYKGVKKVVINPEIIDKSEKTTVIEEGCLSIPDINEKVERPERITIKYLDEHFEEHEDKYDDWMARVMQHEYDHCHAHLFIDRISPLRRRMIKSKLTSIQKRKVNTRYKSI